MADFLDKPACRPVVPSPPPKPQDHKLEYTMDHVCSDSHNCVLFGYISPENFVIEAENAVNRENAVVVQVDEPVKSESDWMLKSIFNPRR